VSEVDQDSNSLWTLLFEIVVDMEKRLFGHLAAHGLTPPQFYVLKTLTEHEGRCRIGQIAEEHHLTNATMTGLIKRMEAAGLVTRTTSPQDGRSVDVMLTEAGVKKFHDVQESIMAQVRLVLHLLPAEERTQIIEKVGFYFQVLRQLLPATVPPVQD
jgi:DNA-binding MarR family transcriptional regulator